MKWRLKLSRFTTLSFLDELRFEKASQNPLFNKKSSKWVATIVQDIEIVVIRQNFQHGFISLGWDDPDKKWIIYCPERKPRQNSKGMVFWNKMNNVAEAMAKTLNRLERN